MRNALTLLILFLFITNIFSQTNNKLYPKSNGLKYGLVNRKGDTIVNYIYDYISVFKNGYALVQRDNKFGMINCLGIENIPAKYDNIDFLNNGLTKVTLNDSCTVVDSLGNYFTTEWYYLVDTPLSNIFRVVKKVDYGAGILIRNTIKHYQLENIIGLARDSVFFSNYLIGYISRKNNSINGLWFSGGENFENGKAKIAISKHTYFLDLSGNITPRISDNCDLSLMNIFRPDEYPEYPGGKAAFYEALDKNFNYPDNLGVMFHNSELIVSFIIDKTGTLISPKIEKSLHPAYDAEALSAISKLEKWKPAKYNGEAVCWQIQLPFRFTVKQ